jgi:hypothetical protein
MCLGRMREAGVVPQGLALQRSAYKEVGACSYLAGLGNPIRSCLLVQEPYTLDEMSSSVSTEPRAHPAGVGAGV